MGFEKLRNQRVTINAGGVYSMSLTTYFAGTWQD